MFNDEYLFAKMARSFFYDFNLNVSGEPLSWGRPLYPILLSISYFFKDMVNVYLVMKIINALLSSLIIFPAYLLAKEFLSKKKSILIAILVSVLPMNLMFSSYIMSENIFYTLFLFSIYFVYKALNEDRLRWIIFSGVSIGLCNLAKIQGLIFLPLVIILFLMNKKFKALLWIILISLLIITPYYLLNWCNFGAGVSDVLGYKGEAEHRLPFSITAFLYWCFLYLGYVILATGIFLFITTKLDFKKYSGIALILFLSMAFLIAIAAFHTSTYEFKRPLGRYVDAIIPGLLIVGLAKLREREDFSYLKALAILIILIFSLKLLDYSLFPVNNLMITYLGGISSLFGKLVSSILILFIFVMSLFIKRLSMKQVVYLGICIFVLISFLGYGVNIYNAYNRWYPLDQVQSGLWFNSFDKNPNKTVFIEDVDVSTLPMNQPLLRAGFWINGEIRFDKLDKLRLYKDIDYLLSTNKLENLKTIKEIGNIKIYYLKGD